MPGCQRLSSNQAVVWIGRQTQQKNRLDVALMHAARFHHFGLAVKQFDRPLQFYRNLGYQASDPVYDPLQGVELILCTADHQPAIELVRPVAENSPIDNYLAKNNEMIYHTCYEVDDFEAGKDFLFAKNRAICVSKPKPAILFGNRQVAFYYVNNVGLFELLEK
jgi:methylmalonyl-CoA/ethylmalonyl-CoA epimerase